MSITYRTPPFFLSMFFIISCLYAQAPTIDDALLQKKLKEFNSLSKNLPSGSLNKLKNRELDSLTTADSVKSQHDSLKALLIQSTQKDSSVYEKILNGQIINPDDLLKKISIFGYDMFKKRKAATLSNGSSNSINADYPVNVGDEIIINMWGRINEEYKLIIDRNGTINIPHLGPIRIAGMPFKTLQQKLIDRIQTIGGVQASVNIGTLSDIRVYIVGEVDFPGQYSINALSSVTDAIFLADGFSKNGSLRNVQLKRNGKNIKTFDFYEFLLAGNNFSTDRLMNDDVIFVPMVKKMAAIVGNVRRSSLYELNGKTSLSNLIELAGGLMPTAWINRIQVERFQQNNYQVVLDLETNSTQTIPQFEIADGDIVKIFPIVVQDKNTVYLSGNIRRPGKYQFFDGMRISDCISSFDQLLPETFLEYAVIKRREEPLFSDHIISFNLKKVIENSATKENLLLKPRDQVIIYNQDFFQPDRKVFVSGAITSPGAYRLLENMHIKDLILEAGGLSEDASTERGELYQRVQFSDSESTTKKEFCVSCALSDDTLHNLKLQKSDHIFIRKKRGWEERKKISLLGEFYYPGDYIVLENETLGNLIERAGGFKSTAYLSAAMFTRNSVKELEKKRSNEYIKQLEMDILNLSSKTQQGNDPQIQNMLNMQRSLIEQLKDINPVGRIVIDFTKSATYASIEIEDGDILYIPKKHNTVSVLGEVFNPATFVLTEENISVKHYIELSGGFKETANSKNVYVIKANGSVRTREIEKITSYQLEAGDAVVVPFKIDLPRQQFKMFMETIQTVANFTISSLNIAATLFTIRELSK